MTDTDVAFALATRAVRSATTVSKLSIERRLRSVQEVIEDLSSAMEIFAPFGTQESMQDLARLIKSRCREIDLDFEDVAPDLMAHVIRCSDSVEACISFARTLAPDSALCARAFKYLWEQLSVELCIDEETFPDHLPRVPELKALFGKRRFGFYQRVHDGLGLPNPTFFQSNSLRIQARARLLSALTKMYETAIDQFDLERVFWRIDYTDELRSNLVASLGNIGLRVSYLEQLLVTQAPRNVLGYPPDLHADLSRLFVLSLNPQG